MDDDLDPKELEDSEDIADDFDDELLLGGKKGKKGSGDEDPFVSLDDLADEEDGILPEDSFDDDKDLW
jgi:hypothetical protein